MQDYPATIKAYGETLKDGLRWVFWNFTEDLMYSACGSYFEIGLLYKKLGQNDNAMKTFQEAETKYPTCAAYGIRQELVSLYAQAERWDELLTYLKQQPDDWQDKKLFLELLDTYSDCDRKPLRYFIPFAPYLPGNSYAIPVHENLEKIVKEYPDCKIAKTASGYLEKNYLFHSSLGTLEQVQQFEQTITKYPGSPLLPEALLQLGTAYEWFGKWDKAISIFKKIKTDYPDSEAASSLLGRTEMLEKKKQHLKIYYLEATEKNNTIEVSRTDPIDKKLIWIATWYGFFKFNKDTETFTHFKALPSGYYSGYDIAFDPFDEHSVWLIADGHLSKYDRKTEHVEKWAGLKDYRIETIKFDPLETGVLWMVAMDEELYKCRLTENQCEKISLPENKPHSFVKDFVSDIETDPIDKNILWVMGRSVNKLNKEKGMWQSYDFLWNVFLKSLKADPFNPRWIWAISNNVLFRFDREKDEWEIFYAESESQNFDTFEVDKKYVWISEYGGITRVDKEKGASMNMGVGAGIKNIITVDEQTLWILGYYERIFPAIYKIDLKGLSVSTD